jgi:hypothetical protein
MIVEVVEGSADVVEGIASEGGNGTEANSGTYEGAGLEGNGIEDVVDVEGSGSAIAGSAGCTGSAVDESGGLSGRG